MIFSFFKGPALSPRLNRLKNSPLFASLTPLELKTIDALLHERTFLTDEIIFDEGEEGHALYLIISGHVVISRRRAGKADVLSELAPGAYFGDMALLDNAPRGAQARAYDNCELAVFFRADFIAVMNTDPVIGYKISFALARHLGQRLRAFINDGKSQVDAL